MCIRDRRGMTVREDRAENGKRELVCIGCPLGCMITVTCKDGQILTVSGNTCKKGDQYARNEVTNPERMVTTTVRLADRPHETVSVKSERSIPKEKIFDFVKALKMVEVKAPVHISDVILSDVAGTGVAAVATVNRL